MSTRKTTLSDVKVISSLNFGPNAKLTNRDNLLVLPEEPATLATTETSQTLTNKTIVGGRDGNLVSANALTCATGDQLENTSVIAINAPKALKEGYVLTVVSSDDTGTTAEWKAPTPLADVVEGENFTNKYTAGETLKLASLALKKQNYGNQCICLKAYIIATAVENNFCAFYTSKMFFSNYDGVVKLMGEAKVKQITDDEEFGANLKITYKLDGDVITFYGGVNDYTMDISWVGKIAIIC